MPSSLRNNADRARAAVLLIQIVCTVLIVGVGVSFYSQAILERSQTLIYVDYVQYEKEITRLFVVSYSYLIAISLAFILAAIFFIRWFRRAYYNLHLLQPKGLRYGEGMAAGAWFIPLFHYFGPFQIASDITERTDTLLLNEGLIERKGSISAVKGWWWGMWVSASLISSVTDQIQAHTVEKLLIRMIPVACYLAAGILCIRFIRLYAQQEELLKRIEIVPTGNVDSNEDLLDTGI